MDSQWGTLMQVKVDYEKRTWTVRACYRWAEALNPMLFPGGKMAMRMNPCQYDLDGKGKRDKFLWSEAHGGLLLKVDEAAGLLRPVAGLGTLMQGNNRWQPIIADEKDLPKPWVKALRDLGRNLAEGRKMCRGFGWADTDGSFDMEKGRLVPYSSVGQGFSGGDTCRFLDADLTLYQAGWSLGGNDGNPLWLMFPAQGRTPSGAPIWDWAKSVKSPGTANMAAVGGLVALRRDASGNTYTVTTGGGDGMRALGTYGSAHGFQWPANQTDATGVCKWDKDGQLFWRVGPHAARGDQKPGQLHYPMSVAGFVKGAVAITDKIVSPLEFWSEDGLYIGGLFDRRADDGLPSRAYAWWKADMWKGDDFDNLAAIQYDMALGGSLTTLPNGDVIYFGCGWNNVPVYRVKGWDQVQRQQGLVKLTAPAGGADGKGNGLVAEGFALPDFTGSPILETMVPRLWFEPARKGFEWPAPADLAPTAAWRWTGMVEPRFTEDYTFVVYAKGNVRLWVGGRLLVEVTDKATSYHKVFAEPVPLVAGVRYPLKAEWIGPANGEFHLNWESLSQPIEHVPTSALYKADANLSRPVVTVRPSAGVAVRPVASVTSSNVAVDWIIARQGATDKLLKVKLQWGGTAAMGRDYEPLPAIVTIPKGETEIRLPVKLMKAAEITPTRELTVIPALSPDYVQDGTRGSVTLMLRDPRVRRLKVATVTVTGQTCSPNIKANLNETALVKLIDGSGLDRRFDPPVHGTVFTDAWYADGVDIAQTFLTCDLSAACDVADMRVWNFNSRFANDPGSGKGQGIRGVADKIHVFSSLSPEGPWTDIGEFTLSRPAADQPAAGDLIPIDQRARYLQIHFRSLQWGAHTIGLAEIELYGEARERK